MAVSKKVVLRFPKRLIGRAIVCKLSKDYNLEFALLKASITPDEEGFVVMELKGEQADYDRGITYLTKSGVKIQSLSQDVTRNEERCTHCGACVIVCPTGAFQVESASRLIHFNGEKCVACGICIKACPPRAMELHF